MDFLVQKCEGPKVPGFGRCRGLGPETPPPPVATPLVRAYGFSLTPDGDTGSEMYCMRRAGNCLLSCRVLIDGLKLMQP